MALLWVSLLKLVKRPATWVVLIIALGLIAIVFLGLAASANQVSSAGDEFQVRVALSFPNAYTFLVIMILSLGGLLGVTYGAAIIGADWAWGTIRPVVARGESRIRYTLVTFLAIAIILALGLGILFLVGSLVTIFAAQLAGLGTEGSTDPDSLATFPDLLGRTWLGITEQTAIGFAVAMIFRSQLAGIAAGLALYFGEIFLAFVPLAREVLPYFPFSVANALVSPLEGLGDGGFGTIAQIDSETALVWTIGYLVLALAIASLSAWRAQITQ
jgi:hypothetical protein